MADDPEDPKVIAFPGADRKPEPRKRVKRGPIVSQPAVPHAKLQLGPISYTCPHCRSVSVITGENLIFRTLDAYCSGCGTLFRYTNQAFGSSPLRPKV
jgi:hypothetical protein